MVHGLSKLRPGALIAAILVAGLASPLWAQTTCEVCGTAVGANAVTVTDWETNRENRYHDLWCAVQQMATRFPWSRAVTTSAASGERITLTRINGSWRAAPDGAVFFRLTPQGATPECGNAIAFASRDEFRAYQEKHRGEIPKGAEATPLENLPARSLAQAPSPVAPQPGAAAPPPAAEAQPPAAPSKTTFPDVPQDHWAYKFVEKAKELGLMQGYPDRTFRGNQQVTRYELAAILARLVERETATSQAQPAAAEPAAVPSPPAQATGQPTAPAGKTPSMPIAAETAARASLLGLSGLLSVPDARVRAAGSGAAVAGGMNKGFLGAAAAGIGDDIEVAATSARFRGESKLFLSAKQRIASLSRPGLDVAAGVTGFGSDTTAFAAATRDLRLGSTAAEVTLGLGSGGILRGPYAGAALPLGGALRFAKSADLVAEWANLGAGRHFNYGLDLSLRQGLGLKVGQVDGDLAAGLLLEGGF